MGGVELRTSKVSEEMGQKSGSLGFVEGVEKPRDVPSRAKDEHVTRLNWDWGVSGGPRQNALCTGIG